MVQNLRPIIQMILNEISMKYFKFILPLFGEGVNRVIGVNVVNGFNGVGGIDLLNEVNGINPVNWINVTVLILVVLLDHLLLIIIQISLTL